MNKLICRYWLITVLGLFSFTSTGQTSSHCKELANQIEPLLRSGDYNIALIISDSCIRVCVAEFGELSSEHAEVLENKTLVLCYMRDYKSAHQYSEKSGAILHKIDSTNSNIYSVHLQNLARILKDEGKIQEAIITIDSAITICRHITPVDYESLAYRLNLKAALLMDLEQQEKAIPLLEEAIEILPESANKGLLVGLLDELANCYESMGEITKAERYMLQADSIGRIFFGEKSIDYITLISNTATRLHHFGKYELSKEIFLESLKLAKNSIGPEHYQTGLIWLNYGQLLAEIGQLENAITSNDSAGLALQKSVGAEHPYYYSFLNNAANLYQIKGEFAKSLQFYFKARDLAVKKAGPESPPVLRTMHNIGSLYAEFGYIEKSQEMERIVEQKWKKLRGTNNPEYATILSQIAQNFGDLNQLDSAILFISSALEITQKLFDTLHSDYATRLVYLGSLYLRKRDFYAAKMHSERATGILLKLFGEEHPEYAYALSKQAQVYREMGDLAKAETILRLALSKMIIGRGERHPQVGKIKSDLAELLEIVGRKDEAAAIFRASDLNYRIHTEAGANLLTEMGREKFIEQDIEFYNRFWSFIIRNPTSDNIYAVFEDAALLKNLLLESQNSLSTLMMSNEEPFRQKFINWKAQKQAVFASIAGVSKLSPTELKELSIETELLEETLIAESSIFRMSRQNFNWDTVRIHLNLNDVLVEYVHFDYYRNGLKSDSVLYYAIVCRPDELEPKLVFLMEEKQLLNALRRGGMPANEQIEDIYRDSILYKLIWQPLEPYLKGVKTIHFSPAGLLHGIAFAGIPTPSGQYLVDQYELRQFGSTRELVTGQKLYRDSIQNARVYGGIRYDTIDNIHKPCGRDLFAIGRGGLYYLPCSPYEMRQVRDILQGKGIKTDTLSGFEATEETMKSDFDTPATNYRSPNLLHISTHGAYYPRNEKQDNTSDRPIFLEMNSPLARSYLAFARAGEAFQGRPRSGIEDGLLTAFEITGLDLSGTKLAVLSACKTALGDIRGCEGVYGLQRAFKIAGVEHLIVSLWEVKDSEATIDFMSTFYKHFLSGLEVRDAFSRTQREMREKYKNPYLWAAFVLI